MREGAPPVPEHNMVDTARGTFEVTMQPGPAELDGAMSRFELSKTFHGDLQGTGLGVMLSGGDRQAGAAGYVAIESVQASLGQRRGSFALQQFGTLRDGSQTLHLEVVPGSGTGGLNATMGTLHRDLGVELAGLVLPDGADLPRATARSRKSLAATPKASPQR